MVSLSRRQVLIGGALGIVAPAISRGAPAAERLVLSGRVVRDGKPFGGASLPLAGTRIVTDADGRFVLVTDTRAYPAVNARRDSEGTWRATFGLVL